MVLPEFVRVSSFCIVFVQFKKTHETPALIRSLKKKKKIKLWPETVRTVSAVLQNSILSLFSPNKLNSSQYKDTNFYIYTKPA